MPSLDRHAKEEDVKRLFLIERLFIAALILFLAVGQWVAQAHADQLPFPEPANENAYAIPSENLRLRVWAQYRVMYNASNIPSGVNSGSLPAAGTGPGQLNFGDTTGYDFLRQRMRLAFDIQQKDSDNVGLYMQVEYRGGFGGSSPAASDPRGETGANADGTANAFNRLQARGVRYGYVYVTPIENHTLVVGILPTIDQVGRVLWDGEWDFNVGGAALGGKIGEGDYRLGFYRIASDLKAGTFGHGFGKDGDMWVADYNKPLALGAYDLKVGGHFYSLNLGKTENINIGDTHENWVALTASGLALGHRRLEQLRDVELGTDRDGSDGQQSHRLFYEIRRRGPDRSHDVQSPRTICVRRQGRPHQQSIHHARSHLGHEWLLGLLTHLQRQCPRRRE